VADRKIPGNPENKIRHSEKIEKALVRRMVPLRPHSSTTSGRARTFGAPLAEHHLNELRCH
jgi:hypothetical protein